MKHIDKLACFNKQLANLKGERWKEIPGHDGLYLVSNYGRLKSKSRYVEVPGKTGFWTKEKILTLSLQLRYNAKVKKKYYDVRAVFSYQNNRFSIGIARLVYCHFIKPIDFDTDQMMVCHKDDNDLNNHVSNLILLSCGDKQRLSYKRKRQSSHLKIMDPAIRIKMLKAKTKGVIQYDVKGKKVAEYKSVIAAAAATGTSPGNISSVARGKMKHTKQTVWKYQ